MSYERINKCIYNCKCDKCGHPWEAETLPQRCAKCRLYSWNGADKRRGTFKRVRVAQKAGKP